MNNLKCFVILGLLVLSLVVQSNVRLYADDFYGYSSDINDYTLKLGKDTQLDISVTKDWQVKTDKDGNTMFLFAKGDSPIVVTVFNNIFPYKTEEEMEKFIKLHEMEAVKTIPNKGKIKAGFDHLEKISIPWLMILEESDISEDKTFHKISYPYNKEKVFPIVTSISGKPEYMKEVEFLLNSIIIAILNQTKEPKDENIKEEIKEKPQTETETGL